MAHGAGGAPDIYQEQVAFRERNMDFEGIKLWMVGSTLVECSPFFGGDELPEQCFICGS